MSVVLVAGGQYSVLASTDLDIGGDQATEVLVQYLGAEFKQKYKEDITKNKRGKVKLATGAETVKHVLSTLDTAHCFVESLFDGIDFSYNVTRARFDNQLSKFMSDILAPISSLLTLVDLDTSDISKAIMTGGTSKIVKLQSALGNKFPGAEILSSFAPDEVTAMGAAVQASYISHDTCQAPRESLMSLSNDIIASVEGQDFTVLVQDSTVPCKRSVTIWRILMSPSTGVKTSLWFLTNISSKSKVILSVHIHRDASTPVTLQDKTSSNASDMMLKMGS